MRMPAEGSFSLDLQILILVPLDGTEVQGGQIAPGTQEAQVEDPALGDRVVNAKVNGTRQKDIKVREPDPDC